jgi:hypothetical protein
MTVTAKDRLIFTLSALKGYSVDVQLTSGVLLNGVLADTREIEKHIVLAYAWTRFLTPRGPNGEEPKKAPRKKPEKLKKVPLEDIAWIQAFNVGMSDLALGPSRMNDMNDFTDVGISKGATGQNRTLVAWTPGDDDTSANVGGLEDGQGGGRSSGRFDTKGGAWGRKAPPGQWDQFAANKQLFGVETKFDESVYTTQIDKSKIRISEQEAARIAREIEGKVSSNPHVAEERNQKLISDFDDDEEAKYSSVSRAPGSEGFKAAPPPSKPAWGSTAGKVPASVASMADAKKTATESTAAAAAQQAPAAPAAEAKKAATGSKLSANAPAFSLSAKASAFVPTKKPAAAVAASPMQAQDAISAAQRAAIMNYQAQMAQMNMMMGYGMGPGAPYQNPMMQYAPQMHRGGQFGGMPHMGGGGYQRGGFQQHQHQQHYQQRQNFQPPQQQQQQQQQQQMKQTPPPAAAAAAAAEQQAPSSD